MACEAIDPNMGTYRGNQLPCFSSHFSGIDDAVTVAATDFGVLKALKKLREGDPCSLVFATLYIKVLTAKTKLSKLRAAFLEVNPVSTSLQKTWLAKKFSIACYPFRGVGCPVETVSQSK